MLACLGGIIAIGGLGFFVPRGYWPVFGSNEFGVHQLLESANLPAHPIDTERFGFIFRFLLVLAWAGYGSLLLIAVFFRSSLDRQAIYVAAALAALIATLSPPWLSSDAIAYLAYGRMYAIYGLNPYAVTTSALQATGDPLSGFFLWDVISPYGPAWTLVSAVVAYATNSFSLLAQVLAMKCLVAAAHLSLAFGVARLTRLLAPRFEIASFILIALSPLYVLEGPGNGHNDAVMLALLVWGVVFWQQGFLKRGCFLLGVSAAIKFLPFLVLFWLLGARLFKDRDWRSAALLAATGFAPFFVLQAFFMGSDTALFSALTAHFSSSPAKYATPAMYGIPPLLLLVAACSMLVIMTPRMHWAFAWTLVSVAAMFLVGPPWPWYLTWSGVFLFAGYSRALLLAVTPFVYAGFMLMFRYSVIP